MTTLVFNLLLWGIRRSNVDYEFSHQMDLRILKHGVFYLWNILFLKTKWGDILRIDYRCRWPNFFSSYKRFEPKVFLVQTLIWRDVFCSLYTITMATGFPYINLISYLSDGIIHYSSICPYKTIMIVFLRRQLRYVKGLFQTCLHNNTQAMWITMRSYLFNFSWRDLHVGSCTCRKSSASKKMHPVYR